jgi:predicted DNA-binding transcriptional regulator AlpA
MSETWLKAKDVANRLGVSSSWVLRKARCRVAPDMAIIPHIRIGGVIRFSEREIEAWMKEHGIKGVLKV